MAKSREKVKIRNLYFQEDPVGYKRNNPWFLLFDYLKIDMSKAGGPAGEKERRPSDRNAGAGLSAFAAVDSMHDRGGLN